MLIAFSFWRSWLCSASTDFSYCCPFCHGWEARDSRIGLLAAGEEHAAHLLPMLSRLTADVEVFDAVAGLRAEDGALRAVVLPDGTEVRAMSCSSRPRPRPATRPSRILGLERTEPSLVAVDTFGRTSATGVYAAGDLVTVAPAVAQALARASAPRSE